MTKKMIEKEFSTITASYQEPIVLAALKAAEQIFKEVEREYVLAKNRKAAINRGVKNAI